jgi:hypothetical protein
MHGGTISLFSKPGEGSEFVLRLPNRSATIEKNIMSSANLSIKSNIEKINIEFSDIYF